MTNCPDTFIEEVADHAMTLILASWRRLVVQDQMVRKGEWAKARPMLYQFPRLMGMTLGFISFGHVARAVAKRAAPFGFQMLAYDPYIEELVMSDYGVQPVGLDELLQRSDIISMHAPGTKDAHHLMKEPHFKKMKKTALFVNTGRGSTVDEAAMIKALQEGWIAGAGLDVLETEPVGHNNPLLGMDNVILTAHVASASSRFDQARKRRVGAEMALVLSRQVAARLRQSHGAGEVQARALAALLDGARAGELEGERKTTITITAGRASRPAGAAPSIIRRCSGSPSSCSWRRSRFMYCPTTCRGGRNCVDRRAVAATRRRQMWPRPCLWLSERLGGRRGAVARRGTRSEAAGFATS